MGWIRKWESLECQLVFSSAITTWSSRVGCRRGVGCRASVDQYWTIIVRFPISQVSLSYQHPSVASHASYDISDQDRAVSLISVSYDAVTLSLWVALPNSIAFR